VQTEKKIDGDVVDINFFGTSFCKSYSKNIWRRLYIIIMDTVDNNGDCSLSSVWRA
jgi:hypothetical protein